MTESEKSRRGQEGENEENQVETDGERGNVPTGRLDWVKSFLERTSCKGGKKIPSESRSDETLGKKGGMRQTCRVENPVFTIRAGLGAKDKKREGNLEKPASGPKGGLLKRRGGMMTLVGKESGKERPEKSWGGGEKRPGLNRL